MEKAWHLLYNLSMSKLSAVTARSDGTGRGMIISGYFTAALFTLLWCAAAAAYGGVLPTGRGHEAGGKPAVAVHARVPGDFAPWEELRTTDPDPARGRFLVATPKLKGSLFEQSVILLIDYSWQGATGLIINKPGAATSSDAFPDIKELADHREHIYLGGPVELGHVHLLIRSGSRPAESREILQDLYLCASMETLRETSQSTEEGLKFRLYVGYSGWSPGQLEREILEESWYVMEAEQDLVFSELPSLIWQKLIRRRSPFHDTVFRKPGPFSLSR